MSFLGIDTSNYTTSAAVYRADGTGHNEGRLLTVKEGELGLRQSDALFQHVKRLPERFSALKESGWLTDLEAVGASTRPRPVEGSYMPCFLAGASQGQVLADTLGVPFFAFSHQEGHIAAAVWSAGRMELLESPMLAWHLSGGTTELLLVEPKGVSVTAKIIGGTSDISAGQLIDRTGQKLRLAFPAGKAIDALAQQSTSQERFRVKLDGFRFSLSGMENKTAQMIEKGIAPEDVAAFALNTLGSAIRRATDTALKEYPGLPVLCSGGVASNSQLRKIMRDAVFAEPQFSTDNAMGIAILTARMYGTL
ncbi:MAG: DNA-binding protein [Oscillospiraceae bacterium]|nr:DNA-binding protein [Oscillospiraceae bacterium]